MDTLKQPVTSGPRRTWPSPTPLIGLAAFVAVSVAIYSLAPSVIPEPHQALDRPTCRHIWLVPRILFAGGAVLATAFLVAGIVGAIRAGQVRWLFLSFLPAAPFIFIGELGRQLLVHVGDASGC